MRAFQYLITNLHCTVAGSSSQCDPLMSLLVDLEITQLLAFLILIRSLLLHFSRRAIGQKLFLEERSLCRTVLDGTLCLDFSRTAILPSCSIALFDQNVLCIVVPTQSTIHRFYARLIYDPTEMVEKGVLHLHLIYVSLLSINLYLHWQITNLGVFYPFTDKREGVPRGQSHILPTDGKFACISVSSYSATWSDQSTLLLDDLFSFGLLTFAVLRSLSVWQRGSWLLWRCTLTNVSYQIWRQLFWCEDCFVWKTPS